MSGTWTRLTRRIALPALLVALLAMAGCNTVRGVGQDMQGIGKAMSGVAEETNPYGP